MAIAALQKILIVGHKSEQTSLLDRLQRDGFVHICPAEGSDLEQEFAEFQEQRRVENRAELLRSRLADSIHFLEPHARRPKSLKERLTPRPILGIAEYEKAVEQSDAEQLLETAQELRKRLIEIDGRSEKLSQRLLTMEPWKKLDAGVEDLGTSGRSVVVAGMIPVEHDHQELVEKLGESGIALESVLTSQDLHYCLVAYSKGALDEGRHGLHAVDFEPANFEGLSGKPAEIIARSRKELAELEHERGEILSEVSRLAERVETFGILHDHFQNLANRDQITAQALGTQSSFFLEGWIRAGDWRKLVKLVGEFKACIVKKTEPAEGEEAPVELQNVKAVRPFEVITSLYGMPGKKDVDPTPFLAPFFALFFGLCLTDAGYGLVLLVGSLIALRILGRGAGKLLWVLAIGGAVSVIIGSCTYGYFGDAPKQLGWGWLISLRDYLGQFGFNPMKEPMKFFILAVGLGYLQLMSGLVIALIHNLRQRELTAALCDQVTWLVLLNSIVLIALTKTGVLPGWTATICLALLLIAAVGIVLGSQREGGLGERLGMGFYNLFSAIFYLGDVLSYLRLMALGMVTGGIAMAVNVIAGIAWQIPFLGILLALVVLVIGHVVNLLLSSLSAFVHTLRLQYVEFFPKFFTGGGAEFRPFARVWKYTEVEAATTQEKARL